jgi:hypothetical protein
MHGFILQLLMLAGSESMKTSLILLFIFVYKAGYRTFSKDNTCQAKAYYRYVYVL